jgi:uncharacterized OsmC-like protein
VSETALINRVRSYSTGTPGRCINQARDHHFVIDEPVHAGGPGEEVTPAEAFLAGVAACGVLLVESQAHRTNVPLERAEATIEGVRKHADPSSFERIDIRFMLAGPNRAQAEKLVEHYKSR